MDIDRRIFIGVALALAAARVDAHDGGSILSIVDKQSGWRVQDAPDDVAFRLHVPLPDRRAHFLPEADAKCVRVEPVNGASVQLRSSAFVRQLAGALPITVTATARSRASAIRSCHTSRRHRTPQSSNFGA